MREHDAATQCGPAVDGTGAGHEHAHLQPSRIVASGDSALVDLMRQAAGARAGRSVSVSTVFQGRLRTMACTDQRASLLDAVQHRLGAGPCIEAALEAEPVIRGTFGEGQWPKVDVAAKQLAVARFECHRLELLAGVDAIAVMTMYINQSAPFAGEQLELAVDVVDRAALLVTALLAQQRAANLEAALRSNRDIGIAMGILMQQHRMTREQAFDALRKASNDTNRKLSDVAADLADTGDLDHRWDRIP